jgi:hypothetical protein
MFLPHVFQEALHVILAEIERGPADSKISEAEIEKVAAHRGIAVIDAGKWKQRDTWVHFPPSWVRQILEMFERAMCLYLIRDHSSGGKERKASHRSLVQALPLGIAVPASKIGRIRSP